MTIDFRASQIQTVKIISSGSTGTNAKILIYDITADVGGAAGNQGQINPAVFSTGSIGEDVFLYISGWSGSLDTSTQGATVFGGDVRVSGTLIVDGSASIQGLGGGGAGTITSGTNYGDGAEVHSGISSSALNFRTLSGSGGIVVSTSGDLVDVSGTIAPVDSVFGRTGAVVATAADYAASEVTNDSDVVGTNVDDALNTLSASNINLSGAVAADVNALESTKLSAVSGTNFSSGSAVHTTISGSDTLNFRTLFGIGGVGVSLNGDAIEISGSVGAVASVFGRTGAVVAATDDYAASEVTNDSDVVGTNVDDALNTLSASNINLSGAVAADVNALESTKLSAVSGTNFSSGSAVHTTISGSDTLNFRTLFGIGGVGVSLNGDAIEISGSVGAVASVFGRTEAVVAAASDYDASQVDNDSTVVGSFVADALNTLSSSNTTLSGVVATDINTLESTKLSEVSGTNFGDAQPLYSSVSSSNVLNFRTISGSDYIGVETIGDVVVISSSQNTLVISPAASITLNLSSSTIFRYELSQNTFISMSNNWDGATGILRMKHDGTANSYAVTWSSQFRRMDSENLNPTQASAAVDIYSFVVDEELVHISKTANWIPVT